MLRWPLSYDKFILLFFGNQYVYEVSMWKIKQVFPRRNLIRPTKMQCKINEYKKPMQVDSHNLYSRWNHSRDLQELHNYEGISKQMNMLEWLSKKVSSVKIKAYHLYQTKCDMGLYIIIGLAFFYTYAIYIYSAF